MNTFINILFVSLFLILITFFTRNYNITNNTKYKLIIFFALFIYQYIILVIDRTVYRASYDLQNILYQSFLTGLIGYIGCSLFDDHKNNIADSNSFSDIFTKSISNKYDFLILTMLIIMILTFVNIIKLVFGYRPYNIDKK
jgi:hypothetical protein